MTHRAPRLGRSGDSGPKPIRSALAGVMKRSGIEARLAEQPALDIYARCVGDEIARLARPVRVRGGVLEVEVASAPLLHELAHFRSRAIVETIRREAPATTVRTIRFRLDMTRP